MDTILVHYGLVLFLLWASVALGWSHSFLFFVAFFYLYQVHERYSMRLQRKIQYEEKKSASQRKLLSDSETIRWLNYAAQKIWPVCLEKIASQFILLPIIPWFLDKFKPWTVKSTSVQKLYLGRNPPMLTDIRVIAESNSDDHLVIEVGMNFLAAEDMDAVLAVQLQKSIGLGITTNMHLTGMHVEGKILVGVKFLPHFPFLGRIRLCFVESPYFQMTVKPLMSHGVDVTEFPGISGWLDKLLDTAFCQTLVEPNMLVVDMDKFVSAPKTEKWFFIDEKPAIAQLKLEILEGADMKPSDMNGLADPYVKIILGSHLHKTKICWKTLSPKWMEEFTFPLTSWETSNILTLKVRDKDPMFDDSLGDCTISINELRGGQRHDMWVPLNNVKQGRVHLAITVVEHEPETGTKDDGIGEEYKSPDSVASAARSVSVTLGDDTSPMLEGNIEKMTDEYEPIDIQGQEKTGVWVCHPGSSITQTWEPRKGRPRQLESISKESVSLKKSESQCTDASDVEDKDETKSQKGGFIKMFRRSTKKERQQESNNSHKPPPTPRSGLQSPKDRTSEITGRESDSTHPAAPATADVLGKSELKTHDEQLID